MTESQPGTAASPTPAAPALATVSVTATPTDPSALASPDSPKSRSNRRNALKSTGPRTEVGKARGLAGPGRQRGSQRSRAVRPVPGRAASASAAIAWG